MQRVLACLAALLFATAVPSAPSAVAAAGHTWVGAPTDVFRTGQYDRGEWIYTNGVRQGRGANTDGLKRTDYYSAYHVAPTEPTHITDDLYNAMTYDFFGSHRATHNGDYQLALDTPAFTGEVAELRLAIDGPNLFVRLLWTSMPTPEAQIATLTFGTGPSKAWPHNAKLNGTYAKALTVWGNGGDVDGTPVSVRTSAHVTEVTVPLSLLPSGAWVLHGGSGLAKGSNYLDVPAGEASATAPGSGGPTSPTNVWDLLFAGDTPWSFDELSQSAQLTAVTATASETVDLTRPTAGPGIVHGDLSRLLHSRYGSGDGIIQDTAGALGFGPPAGFSPPIPNPGFNVTYLYKNSLQDYAMHVPTSYDGGTAKPLVLYLHGYTGLPEEPFHNPTGLVKAIDAKGWLLASALGRGDYFYRGGTPGDADVMEVLADVEKHYKVDRNHIYLMGHSMGGYGTNNVATHHPDLFAAVAPAEGTDSADLHANLRNTPWLEMTAEEDLDTQAKNAKALYASLSADGYDVALLDYQLKIHEYSSIYDTIPRLMSFFSSHTRQTRPAVVSWTRPVGQDNPALNQKYDGAWWLRDVLPAAGVTRPTITVESMALPHAAVSPESATRTDTMTDEQGPTMRSRAELFVTKPSTVAAKVRPGVLKVTGKGARSATLDLVAAALNGAKILTLESTSDRPLTLRLTGRTIPSIREVDGIASGRVTGTVVLPAGTHTVRLVPLVATSAPERTLPTTGLGVALPMAAVALLLLVLAVRRRGGMAR
jgi:predicted esterase